MSPEVTHKYEYYRGFEAPRALHWHHRQQHPLPTPSPLPPPSLLRNFSPSQIFYCAGVSPLEQMDHVPTPIQGTAEGDSRRRTLGATLVAGEITPLELLVLLVLVLVAQSPKALFSSSISFSGSCDSGAAPAQEEGRLRHGPQQPRRHLRRRGRGLP